MTSRISFAALALVSLLCWGCGNTDSPASPSPSPAWPQLSGTYTLTLTPCELPAGDASPLNGPIGPYQSAWTFSQQDDVLTGRYSASSPPGVSSGTFSGSVDMSGRVTVTSLQFSWSSSHVSLIQFSAAGDGTGTKTQISGTVSGELSHTPVFGGIAGTRSVCSGTRMPFTFTRRN